MVTVLAPTLSYCVVNTNGREHLLACLEAIERTHPAAIERATKAMVASEFGEFSGLGAVDRLAAEAGSWPEVADDWQWCARFGYQVIEKRGTGGGASR